MTISRRQWLAGSALLGPLATHSQPPSRTDPPFHPAIAQALLRHAVNAVNAMLQSPPRDPRPFAAAHAVAELVFAHFEETGFQSMLDQHLAQFGPHMQVQAMELSALLRKYGMLVPEDLLPRMVALDAVATAQARQLGWSGLRPLVLRGLEVGMTTLTTPLKMYQRATWEPPWPRIVRKPLLLKDPQLAEELPRLEGSGESDDPFGGGHTDWHRVPGGGGGRGRPPPDGLHRWDGGYGHRGGSLADLLSYEEALGSQSIEPG